MSARRTPAADPSVPRLEVFMHDHLAGGIAEDATEIRFRYEDALVAAEQRARSADPTVSVRLPIAGTTYGHAATLVFFDNLLMESDTRSELAQLERRDRSDVAGLLGRVGAECAGAVALWPHGGARAEPGYTPLSVEALEALFDERHGQRLTEAHLASQQVLSGTQRKLVLRPTADGWLLPVHGAPSTHLIKRSSGRFDGLVANELACLRLCEAMGVPVPAARAVGVPRRWADGSVEPRLIAIERFDRVMVGAGDAANDLAARVGDLPRVARLHQEDFCQVTGRRPMQKYQQTGGPGLGELAERVRRHSVAPAEDLDRLLAAAVLNVLLGNGDAHAKNFALLTTAEGRRLAPLYDVVSTEVYAGLTPSYAMRFGHAERATQLAAADLARLAKDLKMQPGFVRERSGALATRLREVLDEVLAEVEAEVAAPSPVLGRIGDLVRDRCAVMQRISE